MGDHMANAETPALCAKVHKQLGYGITGYQWICEDVP